jgi:hypothetical protein
MSGGEWDYFHRRFLYEMEDFCKDIKDRFPQLADELMRRTQAIHDILHDIDYAVSGDTIIESDKDFEIEAIKKLKDS